MKTKRTAIGEKRISKLFIINNLYYISFAKLNCWSINKTQNIGWGFKYVFIL
jgi:hypothetical protein